MNFGTDECEVGDEPVNTLDGVICLDRNDPSEAIDDQSQLVEICLQLELALEFLVDTDTTPQQALDQIEAIAIS